MLLRMLRAISLSARSRPFSGFVTLRTRARSIDFSSMTYLPFADRGARQDFPAATSSPDDRDVRLYGADFVKGVPPRVLSISPSSVSLFDLAARFFVPTHDREESARAEAVKDGA